MPLRTSDPVKPVRTPAWRRCLAALPAVVVGVALVPMAAADAGPAKRPSPPPGVELQPQLHPPQPVIRKPERPPSRSNAEPSSPIHDYLGSPNARGGAPAGPLVAPMR